MPKSLKSVLFLLVLVLGHSQTHGASSAVSPKKTVSSFVESFLVETLEVEEPENFLLGLKRRQEIELGFRERAQLPFSEGKLTEAGREALLHKFSLASAETLKELILSLGRTDYNNAMLIGPSGAGKTFVINQLTNILTFGVVPEFLHGDLGLDDDDDSGSPFLELLREAFFEKTQLVKIDHNLLSRDNTRSGQAFAKADVRMRSLIMDLFNAARKDFRERGQRTVFILEEVATLPPLVQETLKSILDFSGFKANSLDPIERGSEVGFSVIGITTPGEYREMVRADNAVERRYKKVFHFEASEREALEILKTKIEPFFHRYGLLIEESTLAYLISMRKFFSNPPLAMPHSVLAVMDGLFLWASNPANRHNGGVITVDEAYEYLVRQAHLPLDFWLPSEAGKPPLWDLGARVQARVVGHAEPIKKIVRRIKTGRTTGFRDFQVFIIMGPSGSGKDTLAKVINEVMYGHMGRHLNFSVAGSKGQSVQAIFEGNEVQGPILVEVMGENPANGVIVLNEAKDMPSHLFDVLKALVEEGVLRPRGKDSRERPLGLNMLFIMGQYGEELFAGKSDAEIEKIFAQLSEADLVKILERGNEDGSRGAMPYALIQRAIRTGGIVMLPPVPKAQYIEIVRLNLQTRIDSLKARFDVKVDESLEQYVASLAIANDLGTRGLDGILMDLTETPISEALDLGLPDRGASLVLRATPQASVVVDHVDPATSKIIKSYEFRVADLLRSHCADLLMRGP